MVDSHIHRHSVLFIIYLILVNRVCRDISESAIINIDHIKKIKKRVLRSVERILLTC